MGHSLVVDEDGWGVCDVLSHTTLGVHISLAHLQDGVGEQDQQMSSP